MQFDSDLIEGLLKGGIHLMVLIISWLANALALYLVARLLPQVNIVNLVPASGGFITWTGFWVLMTASLVLGVLNAVLRPVLNLLSLPITIITLGLFSVVVTGTVFWLTTVLVPGFEVASFWWAIIAGVLFGLLNGIINHLLGLDKKKDKKKDKKNKK